VNCAGRTRSILGAQTLINFGVSNPVYALENGTQGWVLSDRELERGADRRYPAAVDASALPALRTQAQQLMQRHGVSTVTADEVRMWLKDANRTTYLLDVRTPEEFAAGTLPGAAHAPGGQLVQATDQWVGIRNARIVLIDSEGVRAPVVASWLKQLGCDVYVLQEGTHAKLQAAATSKSQLPVLATLSAAKLRHALDASMCTVFDVGGSMTFRKSHIPGAHWSIRSRLADDARNVTGTIVLVADEPDLARAAALDLLETGVKDLKLLEGGLKAWMDAGYPTEATPETPRDSECIEYLFFVHDRHAGNREAMKQYLAWETGLISQLDGDERKLFKVGARG
jgi:rhodanese-related sulfurtransferase